MQVKFIKNNAKNKKLILIFLGYSFLPQCLNVLIANTQKKEFDLCVVYDYSNLNFDILQDILQYKHIYLIAWSMGVWAANLVFQSDKFNDINLIKKVAINGTIYGIDDERGIPKNLFKKSIDEFDFENFKRLCFLKDLDKVDFEFGKNPKNELEQIYIFSQQNNKIKDSLNIDKTIISKRDFIFPTTAYTNLTCEKKFINAPHFPFFYFKNFGEIFEI
ncbi:Biotin synthesis protein BioG [Campylobacter sputorum subsp. bubulus]|uniref:Biotin synthesis protein BioG n=1 Tax=Campylobacter sputorum subsp. sputorum TaxID=32024 RepID=A0A381DLK5_9BACT|nr:pimeloyl-ACP methyl esterase BioG family protein [Campylobacter sputorum]ASM34789.1 DUF452 domain protein [Campylobacter sputorum aubsp. sputorum RM3237]KAB0581655.1 DUF452 family protein [Campylobacter sputorum subsp. sputorum]QEL04982.1 DUF452 domain-containing protein [Campylobacter sputorum subsp. sputorum]SUX10125.1 Biotin synthesis protein BioG [Campylobacter sputorum subsp. bubulus]SUX11470.1 Biotin synthesis protein BioG [Campylobacter sputorum subsp. sputorum]